MNKQNTHQERFNDLTECYNDENFRSAYIKNNWVLNLLE